jgi:hypothetical protein
MKGLSRFSRISRFPALAALLLTAALVFTRCEQPAGRTLDSDAALKSLSLSAGNLSPPFSAGTTDYRATVSHGVDRITLVSAANSETARVSPGGETERVLTVGENQISLVVTAEDGGTRTYTVRVRRLDGSSSLIESKDDLAKMGLDEEALAKNYVLASDLELEDWTPVGNAARPFSGSLDGAGYTLSIKSFAPAAFIDTGSGDPGAGLGVFGWTRGSAGSKALIKNITLKTALTHSISRTGAYYVGALVGYADEYTELDSITVEGVLDFSNTNTESPKRPVHVGGIAGALIASEIKDSLVNADIRGSGRASNGAYNYVGGVAGMFDRNQVSRGMNPKPLTGPFTGASITRCRFTGNVAGAAEGAGSNVFAGGIAGGSCYGMKTYYSGKIEDCSAAGTVSARGGAYWSWAGGIAGTICGDGYDDPDTAPAGDSATGPTRIVRSFAAGTITAAGPPGAYPYAGGIVGNNYYGGLVSQCWFDGEAAAEGTGINDYTGGIAGYNAKQYYGHGSRIEDCWSAGTVEGNLNAGGIVGQNQAAALTERCYSTALVSIRAAQDAPGGQPLRGAGGIAGYNAETDGRDAGTVRNCVALNPQVSSGGLELLARVAGNGGGPCPGNLARADMELILNGSPVTRGGGDREGADCAALPDQRVYQDLGWDFAARWKMGGHGYPVLIWQD